MTTADGGRKDPYDEAENTVRKNIRKLIVLQSQALEELRTLPPNTPIAETVKGAEVIAACAAIEGDIGELQKVIDAINGNPQKYRISPRILCARQVTIDEFRSKLKGVKDRNEAGVSTAPSSRGGAHSLGSSIAQHQLQTQKNLLEQQDEHLSALTTSAQSLHQNAQAINLEVTSQNALLSEVNTNFSETQLRLHALGKRMAVYLDTNNPSLLKLVIMLSAIAIVLLMVIVIF